MVFISDTRFAGYFIRPAHYYTIVQPTEKDNTLVTAKLRMDFNYDLVVMYALANATSAYARYEEIWKSLHKNKPSYAKRKSHCELHDDVIKWTHFLRYWPFVRGIHRSPVNSPHKGQGRGALMFSLICIWINGWVNNRKAGDLRRYCAHYGVIVMLARPHDILIFIVIIP